MENLTISDPSPHGGSAPPPGARGHAQGPPQLPPQMFTTAAQLLDLTDKKLMVALRDGRKLIGVLRSWDQFANLVLQSTTERIFAPKPGTDASTPEGYYADIPHGIFLVRGENVLLLGEIDLDKDDDPPPNFEPADLELVRTLAEEKKTQDRARDKKRLRKLATMGFEGENLGEAVF
ncbi:small nuclear ribonucleoprotein (LSM1) [Metarhizium rileyi]|uniref:U6 snRNA-associated Sm-like protein LSm1 n=1 Tax=Metarhizium rileyi (strain RCEF 4871) TaxID=1649241 RepID=A0A167G6A4_METRR|nr:small nuclear ribonucleoprotein (LSM1) [Metarhizium rileyi RCEF 4871]